MGTTTNLTNLTTGWHAQSGAMGVDDAAVALFLNEAVNGGLALGCQKVGVVMI